MQEIAFYPQYKDIQIFLFFLNCLEGDTESDFILISRSSNCPYIETIFIKRVLISLETCSFNGAHDDLK